jgi:hypothetical protein
MIDPTRNTRYAARFMVELYNRLGSWDVAAAAYHSTNPERGRNYLQKVMAARESFEVSPLDAPDGAGGETLLLTAIPAQLDGILAFAGNPLVALASAPPADGFEGETPFDDAPPAPSDTGSETMAEAAPHSPPPPRPSRATATRQSPPLAPPDLPMVIAAATVSLALPENLPPRLRHRWAEVEAMRAILSSTP